MADVIPHRPSPPLLDDDCALFLDVDGTLVDFSTDPSAVRLLPAVREAVGQVADRLGGAVALVSGRPLEQLDTLFAPLQLPAAGLHGHQMRGDAHAPVAAAGDSLARLQALHRKAAQLALDHPGVQVEDKGVSMALHWRAVPQAAEAVTGFARQHLEGMPGYRLQPGDHVVEFVPEGSDKGRAVERMMARAPFTGRTPVFVGDDLTDEFGFAAANHAGGWSVLVGSRTTSAATHALPGTRAVHAWLMANATHQQR
ncbi:trehalose-phosphatase [Pseudoxanthomonas koreensis]|uniref:trehalose-phosphatase n=1 Tax=Pseudoxanthomonas koreensis TaxID=266061 RepID=UPI0035A66F0F